MTSKMDEQGKAYYEKDSAKGSSQYLGKQSEGQSLGSGSKEKVKSLRDSNWKWVMLTMTSIVLSGNFFCYDNPASIETTLEQEFGVSQTEYSLLYSVYAIPNTILPIFGGVLIDSLGLKISILLFSFFNLLGQCIFCAGGFMDSFKVMIIGRFVFGIGGESVSVATTYIISKWFKGNWLAFALGLNLSCGYLFTSLNGIILPLIYNPHYMDTFSLGWALFIGVVLCIICLIFGILIGILETKAEEGEGKIVLDTEKFHYNDIKSFSFAFWMICGTIIFTFSTMLAYLQVASKMLQTLYMLDPIIAGRLYSIPYYLVVVTAPWIGLYADKYGGRIYLFFVTSLLCIAAHVLNMILPTCDETCYIGALPVLLIGIAFCLYCANVWCIIPDVVPVKIIGTAFGFGYAFYNIGQSLSPIIGSQIHDHTLNNKSGFYWQSVFWLIEAIIGLFFITLLQIENSKTYNGSLNTSPVKYNDGYDESDVDSQLRDSPIKCYETFEQEQDQSQKQSSTNKSVFKPVRQSQ